MIVAVDGPAGAGKSTVAREVARRLGWTYVDTGAMYRAIALALLEREIEVEDEAAIERVARGAKIELPAGRVLLDGRDVTDTIRDERVTEVVSRVAALPVVRAALVERQRELAASRDVVMEGRDIGTAVAPDAEVKVFLTASLEERARRRWDERRGSAALDQVAEAIAARDEADSSREASPLTVAADAVSIDSTGRSIDEVVDTVVELVMERRDR